MNLSTSFAGMQAAKAIAGRNGQTPLGFTRPMRCTWASEKKAAAVPAGLPPPPPAGVYMYDMICVYMCVCVYVCMHICIYVCVCMYGPYIFMFDVYDLYA